jgi:flagellar hook-associated protein 2
MVSVSSAVKVDGVDIPAMASTASAFARPATPPPNAADTEPDTRISSAGKLRSATAAVMDAASTLTKARTWSATQATSSEPEQVDAVSQSAKAGEYAVSVDALAAAQATASATFSSLSTVIGIGTLNIELGSWNASQTAFATNPNWPKANVTIGPKDTSLERIRDKINAAGIGVIAAVVSDATGSRLVLRSTGSGANNGFKVSADPQDQGGEQAAQVQPESQAAQSLAALGFDPSAVNGNTGMQLVQAGQDAKLRIDGRAVESAQNLVEDEASGLSLNLKASTDGEVKISVAPDPASVHQKIGAFVQAYNDLTQQLASPDEVDEESRDAAQAIQNRVQAVFDPRASGGPSALSDQLQNVGIQMGRDGQLQIDPARLTKALQQQPERVQQLFAGDAGDDPRAPQAPQGSGLGKQLLDTAEAPAPTPTASAQPSQPSQQDAPASDGQTAAGTLYRRKLLAQYAQTREPAEEATANHTQDDELLILSGEA